MIVMRNELGGYSTPYDKETLMKLTYELEKENLALKEKMSKLICEIGDEVYAIVGSTPAVEQFYVDSIEIHKTTIWFRLISPDVRKVSFQSSDYNKRWFTDFEQAMAVLEKYQKSGRGIRV